MEDTVKTNFTLLDKVIKVKYIKRKRNCSKYVPKRKLFGQCGDRKLFWNDKIRNVLYQKVWFHSGT